MALKVSHLKSDQRTTRFEYAGEEINITYRPSEWTPEVEDEYNERFAEAEENEDSGESTNFMLEILQRLIISWDVLDDNDQQYPTTVEYLRKLPNAFLLHSLTYIWRDMSPGEARKPSGSFSRRRA